MSVWFISRHPGAIEWMKAQGQTVDHWVSHLDVERISAGDTVIGTLPVHLAAQVCAKGAKFYFLSVNVTEDLRGKELSAQQLNALECTLEAYDIRKCS